MKNTSPLSRSAFEQITAALLKTGPHTIEGENWLFSLEAENSQFIRFNHSRVRQIGTVLDATFSMTLLLKKEDGLRRADKAVTIAVTAGGEPVSPEEVISQLQAEMDQLRRDTPGLPVDPFATLPQSGESSFVQRRAELPSPEHAVELLREPLAESTTQDIDLAGIFASGTVIRASATSAGQKHWFESDSFSMDYSLYTPEQKALKNLFSGGDSADWSSETYRKTIEKDRQHLKGLERPSREVPRGEYRTYLGPQAVHELLGILSYGSLSEAAIRQQESPLRLLRTGEKEFSPLFHLTEDFTIGLAPRFNDEGVLSPETLPLISSGKLVNTLISSRTAAEYRLKANGALDSETLRSPVMHAASHESGGLKTDEILKRLGTGLYLSNLHYLNWSDQFTGRVTGMTRYACFWVENGEIVAPIRDLRFDESIFALFGSELEALTEESVLMSATDTYGRRQVGGAKVPGMLVRKMKFTL
jgi:predicted Zn-dependent protease